ncbi:protein root UVB sensitive 5 [Sesamum angolense]|uniref:Protein root UVB sensitive 5 n=1 Tax=Sesamum angolense TaxID=2727404 RepID=A0AAE2BSH1_9LAMI|nr:protein root UVB sensitive 5 [Sesamum angolense]
MRFSCHSFGLDSRRNSIPAPVHRFHIRCKSSLPHSAGAQDSQSLEDDGDAHLILLEKYGNGTSKRYVVEGDSQIRTILEEPLPGTKVLQDSYSMGTDKALTWLPKVVKDFVLPAGFPDSVSDDYLEYILLQFPTNVTGWICHTLVTSSLLQAVGVGSLSGTAAAASAAAIRWVSKDGIGAVGRLFIGGRFGNLFDDDPKQWRLYADFIGSTGSIFDLSTQLYPAYFLPLASLGNLAKEEVWEVAAELVGLALGILALDTPAISSSYPVLASTWLATRLLHLWFRYLSLSVLRFNTVRMLLELYAEEKYFLVVNQVQTEFEVFVSFKEGATSISVLRSVWQSYWLHQNWSSSDDIFSQLDRSLIELKDRGYLRTFLRCHSKVERDFLMGLFERGLRDELQHLMSLGAFEMMPVVYESAVIQSLCRFMDQVSYSFIGLNSAGVRISIIGDVSKLLKPLQVLLADAMETTINNSRLHLIIAVNYSGQNDIVQACQKLAVRVKDGLIEPEEINEFLVERELETNCTDFPYPDLLIRTSGEIRISNFLLWQLAYTELYFAHSLWPDFGEDEFREAVCSFQMRQRRYGGQKS